MGVGATVAGQHCRERIGHLFVRQQIAATNFKPVYAEAISRLIDQPLDEEIAFVAARSTIRAQ